MQNYALQKFAYKNAFLFMLFVSLEELFGRNFVCGLNEKIFGSIRQLVDKSEHLEVGENLFVQ